MADDKDGTNELPAECESVAYKIGDTDYVLREASGEIIEWWQDLLVEITKPSGDGKPTRLGGIAGVENELLSKCIFVKGSETPVPLATVKKWPTRTLTVLNKKLKEISGLGEQKAPSTDGGEEQPSEPSEIEGG